MYLVVVSVVAAAYFLVPNTPISKLLLYNGVGLSAVLAIFVGIHRNAPTLRRPWLLIAVGQISFLTADVVYYVLEAVTDSTPFPSPADVFFLGMYPFLIAGLLGLFRQVSPGRDLASFLDALLVAVATFAVLGILVMDTYISDPALALNGRLISLAYPVMDVLVLAVAARLVASIQLRNPSYALLAAGITSLLVADTIYGILNSAGAFQTGGFADAFWVGFYVLLAAAALHPAMAAPPPPRVVTPGRITMVRLGVLCLVTLAVPIIDLVWGEPFDKILTTVTSMIMFVLVLGRLMGLMNTIRTSEALARHDSLHDPLTGLANRVLFGTRLAEHFAAGRGGIVTVLFIDLDDFKTVNDSLGHKAGDVLLQEVSRRLQACVRPADTVARFGGDEFAVLLASGVDRQDAAATAHRLLRSVSEPIVVLDREVIVSASIGIALEARDTSSVDAVLRGADAAMYGAKAGGKGRFEFFEQSRHTEAVDRLELRRDLQGALDRDEFEIYYQPLYDVTGQRVVSVEALIRWNHPVRGLVMPDDFVPLAEQSGLIVPLGQWILREASAQVSRWSQEYGRRLGVAVNLSVRQLHHPGLLEDVAEALRRSGLDPEYLTLEITESMLIGDAERGARALEQLKALKVRIAIDDFGTGYSSLSYLSRFPFDTIKIDRSFVRELATSATSEALVRTVISLARSLGMSTVAEGVEDRDQLRTLRRLECDLVQGFLFSRPVNAASMAVLIESPPTTGIASAASAGRSVTPLIPTQRSPRSSRLDLEVHDGQEALWDLWTELDALHDATGVPLMSRTSWLDVWADHHPEWAPRTVVVRDRGSGRIEAAAPLARRTVDDVLEIVSMGHGWGVRTALPVRSVRAARPLAKAIAAQVLGVGRPARLEFQQVSDRDQILPLLRPMLPGAQVLAQLPVPRVAVQPGDTADTLLSRNLRRQLRKAQNRIEADGVVAETVFDSSLVGLDNHLETLMEIHRRRDHDTGRPSDLDAAEVRRYWHDLLVRHCRTGQVELAMLRLDGVVAGYVIALLDGESYRVVDGHFDTRYSRYSPGRLVEAAALERVIADPTLREVDWMSGVAPEKILFANAEEARWNLTAAVGCDAATIATPAGITADAVPIGSRPADRG